MYIHILGNFLISGGGTLAATDIETLTFLVDNHFETTKQRYVVTKLTTDWSISKSPLYLVMVEFQKRFILF